MTLINPYRTGMTEAGCDEAGRGCLAGPVFAAAVILPPDYFNSDLDDSKKLTPRKRDLLRKVIMKDAIAWAIASCSNTEIDSLNILRASITAMHRALDTLQTTPDLIIVDGNRFYPYKKITHVTIVGGDAKYLSIAAASILAKTERDMFMEQLDHLFPQYGWRQNKGYPTAAHRQAVMTHGVTPWHRLTFNLCNTQAEIRFL